MRYIGRLVVPVRNSRILTMDPLASRGLRATAGRSRSVLLGRALVAGVLHPVLHPQPVVSTIERHPANTRSGLAAEIAAPRGRAFGVGPIHGAHRVTDGFPGG